jgi:hypothetical protein
MLQIHRDIASDLFWYSYIALPEFNEAPIYNARHNFEKLISKKENSMELSPYWDAASCAATQQFTDVL